MKTGKALLAVLTGVAAGVAFGLIFSHENEAGRKKDAEEGRKTCRCRDRENR